MAEPIGGQLSRGDRRMIDTAAHAAITLYRTPGPIGFAGRDLTGGYHLALRLGVRQYGAQAVKAAARLQAIDPAHADQVDALIDRISEGIEP